MELPSTAISLARSILEILRLKMSSMSPNWTETSFQLVVCQNHTTGVSPAIVQNFSNHSKKVLTAPRINGLYTIKASQVTALVASADALADWHRRLGHLNVKGVAKLVKEGRIKDLKVLSDDVNKFQCASCITGKGRRLPALPHMERAAKPLEIVHIDIWGQSRVKSVGGASYFLTCYDDCTRKVHLYFLKQKSDAFEAIKTYLAMVENQLSTSVKIIRSDNGGEFTSTQFTNLMRSKGIQHIRTPPDSHAQNGRVERLHLTILNGVRTVLADSGLGQQYWAEAAQYTAYTRNRCPCGPQQEIPDDKWFGRQKRHNHLYAFGTDLFYRNHTQTNKLGQRYKAGRLLGYVDGTHHYRVLDTETNTVKISRDVVFSKTNNQFKSTKPNPTIKSRPSTVTVDDNNLDLEPVPQPAMLRLDLDAARRLFHNLENQRDGNNENTSESNSESDSSVATDSSGSTDPLNLTDHEDQSYLAHALLATNSPNTYQQARHSVEFPDWQAAMDKELTKMDLYKVWEVVSKTPDMRILKGRWVYTRKIDGTTGKPAAFKARFVAKGYNQVEGLDYNELFSAVAHKDSIRVFLALVNYFNLECDQVDIVAAFLNGDLEETIYMEAPEGSDIPANKVLRLRKSLYGLKQSPRCFNKKLDSWLKSQGLAPTRADSCIYVRHGSKGELLMLSVHVDDQLVACNNRQELDQFKAALNAEFECSDSGPAGYFLGFNIHRDRQARKLHMSQEHYFETLLDRFDMKDCNPARNPLPTGFKSITATDDEHQLAKHLPFPQVVGSILYASTITRPDLAHSASLLARYIGKWNLQHWAAAKHLLRYIRGTSDLCLTFTADNSKRLVLGYADADWGGDLDTRRSTTGYIFKVYGGVVAWRSRRQPTVALSTTEAEYMASADAARQATWLRLLLDDLKLGLDNQPLPIFNDNAGTVAISKNPVHHDKTKHIALRHHYIREKVEDNTISLNHVPSASNIADLLTKSLPRETFDRLRELLGLGYRSDQGEVSEI